MITIYSEYADCTVLSVCEKQAACLRKLFLRRGGNKHIFEDRNVVPPETITYDLLQFSFL